MLQTNMTYQISNYLLLILNKLEGTICRFSFIVKKQKYLYP